jgi:ApaG protein
MAAMEKLNCPGFIIETRVSYLPDRSSESERRFVFSYTISITNISNAAAQLLSRHWVITDANNQVQEVRGQGVVGEQPLLKPNQSFEYTSGTALTTQVGTMRGSYRMQGEDGNQFDIDIPVFVLSVPRVLH